MVQTLDDPAWRVRRAAVRALAERFAEAPDVWPRLLAAANDPDAAVREAAVEALSGWRTTEQAASALPVFRDRSTDVDEAVRRAAVEGLGRLGQVLAAEAVAGALAAALRNESEEVRAAAAQALGQFDGTSEASLRQALRDPDRAVRHEALRALGRHARADVVPDLLAFAESGAESADAAAEALAHLGRRFPEIESALLMGWGQCGPKRRRVLAQALAVLHSAAALEQLRSWLRHPRRNWRWRALPLVELFLPLDPALAGECLTALDDSHVRVRLAALRLVRSLGRAALPAVPRLIRRRFDGDRSCRVSAALALAHLAEYYPPIEGNFLRRLAAPSARPGELMGDLEQHSEFREACERRRRWHARHGRPPEGQVPDAEHAWRLALWGTLRPV